MVGWRSAQIGGDYLHIAIALKCHNLQRNDLALASEAAQNWISWVCCMGGKTFKEKISSLQLQFKTTSYHC